MKEKSVLEAKINDEKRNTLIEENISFVVYIVSQTLGRYLQTENDVEFSIGLEAFNNAIDNYDRSKGNFEAFAASVIKNKIIDEMRANQRKPSWITHEDEMANLSDPVDYDLKFEINEYNDVLKGYGLDIEKLAEISPNHRDTRLRAIKCAKLIAEDDRLKAYVIDKKNLPMALISKYKYETRRFAYANRQYILASSLVYINEFNQLSAWINELEGGGSDEI